jgi:hypothetical protein
MARYNHALTLAFSVVSNDPGCNDLTFEQLADAVTKRLRDLQSSGDEYKEAVLPPFDTYEEDE